MYATGFSLKVSNYYQYTVVWGLVVGKHLKSKQWTIIVVQSDYCDIIKTNLFTTGLVRVRAVASNSIPGGPQLCSV